MLSVKRIHFFEIEDQSWCPAPIRDGATDYLQFVENTARPYRPVAARLAAAIRASSQTETGPYQVVDLCSGAGGPWPSLLPLVSSQLDRPLAVCLTDLYPNMAAWERLREQTGGQLDGRNTPVNAGRVPGDLPGFRTLFSGFHHFKPADARRILVDAVEHHQGIAIFEVTERKLPTLLGMLFVPLFIWLVTPFLRPFRWSRLLFTYLLPGIPLIGLFDGFISCLRTYTPAELKEIACALDEYQWDIGQESGAGFPAPVTYAIGFPKAN